MQNRGKSQAVNFKKGEMREMEINVTQELINVAGRDYVVIMTVDRGNDVETIEFNYTDTNGIHPLYNSLTNTIRSIEDAHVNLTTVNPTFVREIEGRPNKNSRLLTILNEVKDMQGVTISASVKE